MSQRFTKGWASENKSFYEVGAAYLDFWRNLFPIFTQFALVDTKEGNLEANFRLNFQDWQLSVKNSNGKATNNSSVSFNRV